MLKIILAILFVAVLSVGGKTFYNNQKAEKLAKEVAENTARKVREEQLAKKAEEERLLNEQRLAEEALDIRKKELEKLVRGMVLARLKDPDSAQFRSIKVNLDVGVGENDLMHFTEDAVCGEVNAKNSFGGYTGYSMFIWSSKGGKTGGKGQPELIMQKSGNKDVDEIWAIIFPKLVQTYCM